MNLQLSDPEQCRFLYSLCDREVHYLVVFKKAGEYHINKKYFAFIALRFVKFQDAELLVSFCRNCPVCKSSSSEPSTRTQLFEGQDYEGIASSAFLTPDFEPLCALAQRMLRVLFNDRQAELRSYMAYAFANRGAPRPPLFQQLSLAQPSFCIVFPDSSSPQLLDQWGLVRRESSSAPMLCKTCDTNKN